MSTSNKHNNKNNNNNICNQFMRSTKVEYHLGDNPLHTGVRGVGFGCHVLCVLVVDGCVDVAQVNA